MARSKTEDSADKKAGRKNKRVRKIVLFVLLALLITDLSARLVIRSVTKVPDYSDVYLPVCEEEYDSEENIIRAISLSYLVYGLERKNMETLYGRVSEMLDCHDMGIIIENYGVTRENADDPSTALFDTAEFIRRTVGDFRYIRGLKNSDTGFFGAALCDDERRTVWITYAGAIDTPDMLACAGLAAAPGFTSQEKSAFELFESVLQSDEVREGYDIILTGHSLGGALATMVSLSSGCPAVTVNGADGLAFNKISHFLGRKPDECCVYNFLTSPDGKFTFMENVQRLMFLGEKKRIHTYVFEKNGYTDNTHCAFSFVRFYGGDHSKPVVILPE